METSGSLRRSKGSKLGRHSQGPSAKGMSERIKEVEQQGREAGVFTMGSGGRVPLEGDLPGQMRKL